MNHPAIEKNVSGKLKKWFKDSLGPICMPTRKIYAFNEVVLSVQIDNLVISLHLFFREVSIEKSKAIGE